MSMPGGVGGLRREPHPTRLDRKKHPKPDGCRPSRIVKAPGVCPRGSAAGRSPATVAKSEASCSETALLKRFLPVML